MLKNSLYTMVNNGYYVIITFVVMLFLTGCEAIFHGLVTPNRCKGCEVVNQRTGEVVWQDQGCGGGKANIEDNAKIEAYEYNSEQSTGCVYKVECETWKEEDDEEE